MLIFMLKTSGNCIVLFLSIAFLFVCRPAYSQPAPANTKTTIDEDSVLIMTLRMADGLTLREDFLVYPQADTYLFSLLEFCQAAEVFCEAAGESVSGFIFREDWSFTVACGPGAAIWKSKATTIQPGHCYYHEKNLYISLQALKDIFKIRSRVEPYLSEIFLDTEDRLPAQERWQRNQTNLRPRTIEDIPANQIRVQPGSWFDGGFVDVRVSSDEENIRSHQKPRSKIESSQSFELLGMDYFQYIAFDSGRLIARRQNLQKVDNYGRTLPFGIKDVQLVDVETPRLPLIGSRAGKGIALSNIGTGSAENFDTHTFRGFLGAGWEVEIYHNGQLIGRTEASQDGQYEFQDIPLNYGINDFRLVFYGPHGQIAEELRSYAIDPQAARKGSLLLRLGAVRTVDSGTSLDNVTVLTKSSIGHLLGFSAGIAQLSYLVPTADSGASLRPDIQRKSYVSGGLHGFIPGGIWRFDHAADHWQGHASQATLKYSGSGYNATLRTAKLTNFTSDWFSTEGEGLSSQTAASIANNMKIGIPIFSTAELVRNAYGNGSRKDQFSHRMGGYFAGTYFANHYERELMGSAPWNGDLTANFARNRRTLRGELSYRRYQVTGIDLECTIDFATQETISIFGGRDFQSSANVLRTSYARMYLDADWEVFFGWRTGTREFAGLSVFSSVGSYRRPFSSYRSTGPLADGTSLQVRLFLDGNRNGVFEADEKPLPGVYLTYNGIRSLKASDELGLVKIPRIPVYTPVVIDVDVSSVEDPLMHPAETRYYVEGRRGKPMSLDIALVYSGEIDGTVVTTAGGEPKGLLGKKMLLQRLDGGIVEETTTLADGFFLFEKVPPGSYIVSPGIQPDKQDLFPKFKQINIPENGGIFSVGRFEVRAVD
jgi:hypothetical protein